MGRLTGQRRLSNGRSEHAAYREWQNANAVQSDLEANQDAQDAGSGGDAELYKNVDGAQTGGTRAFNANVGQGPKHNTEQFSAAQYGSVSTRTPQSDNQGITNHSASEESARQEKVVSQRPDALAGVDVKGNKV